MIQGSIGKRLGGGLLCGLLMCGAVALPASAQDQLPDDYAQQQVPQSFGYDDAPVAIPDDGQAISEQQPDVASQMVNEPEAEAIPDQPETTGLVRATAMGQSANGNGQLVQQDDVSAQQQPSQALPQSILDRYGASPAADGGDALPTVDAGRVRIQGDFDNMGSSNVTLEQRLSPEQQTALQEEIRQEAFDAVITGMFPLSPGQIRQLLGRYEETQRAVNEPPKGRPTPEVSVQNVSLDPGVLPPSIKTAVGHVTTLNILDATGAPWPVQDVTWAGDFEIVEPEQGGHIIRITPVSNFARGNIVIRLLTLKTPLTLTLETSSDTVQYRVDARIPEYGPFAETPLIQGGSSMVAGDSTLTALLDGVPPSGMLRLNVSGVDGRTTAYAMGGKTYVRTPLTLLSPAWQSSVSSADGMNVYVMNSAPVVLLSDGGNFERATLREKEDLLDE